MVIILVLYEMCVLLISFPFFAAMYWLIKCNVLQTLDQNS